MEAQQQIKEKEVVHVIGVALNKYMYAGKLESGELSHPASFILARQSQIDNFELMKQLGRGNDYIVTVDHLAKDEKGLAWIVAEPLVPLDSLFKMEETRYSTTVENKLRSDWFKKIEPYFTPLLTDLVHGLIYLDSLDHYCGDILSGIYIDMRGHVKILPSFKFNTKEQGSKMDLKQLVSKMKFLIFLPFPEDKNLEAYQLPYELERFMDFASSSIADKLKYLPLHVIYNHPYFWSVQENINFMSDLSSYTKEYHFLEEALRRSFRYCNELRVSDDWSSTISHGVFRKIFERAQNDESSIARYSVKVPVEIVRYVRASYHHVNDDDYTKKNSKFTEVEVESVLQGFFPGMYVGFYKALCDAIRRIHIEGDGKKRDQITKCFKKWSSPYFAKEVNSILTDKVKELFKADA